MPQPLSAREARAARRRTSRASRARRCPTDLDASLRPYQEVGVDWLVVPARRRARRGARRRHGSRQDAADDLRAARPHARRVPEERRLQLGGRRSRASARPPHRHLPRRRARARSPTPTSRSRPTPCCASTSSTSPTRSWDIVVLDEAQAIKNPDEPDRARGVPAARQVPRRAQRHAGREPPRGALEHHALREPRPARRAQRLPGALSTADRGGRRRTPRSGCARRSARSSCAA